jgi:hypothetical protein
VRYLFLSLTISVLLILPCQAQKPEKPAQKKAQTPAAKAQVPAAKTTKKQTPADNAKAAFHPNVKRDPFRSLIVPKKETARSGEPVLPAFRPAGLPGIAVGEVSVIGVASNHNARLAILQGKEKISYFGKVGDKLYNGFIAEIDPDKVIFVEEATGPDGKKVQKRSVKRLYAEMETAQQRRE